MKRMERDPAVSIVIRTLNEAAQLRKLLVILKNQNYLGEMQFIVVDNESSDDTAKVAKGGGAEVVMIPRDEFSYPKSMNLGVAAARHEAVVMLVAHAYPFSQDWLAGGVSHLKDPKVAGVYANVIPYEEASADEKAFYMPGYEKAKARGPYAVEAGGMGLFGATNALLRRQLWEQHHFDERYGQGGEDGQWAAWAMSQGYKIINDYRFSVRHSHGLDAAGLQKQIEQWEKLAKPAKFARDALSFRTDLDFD